MENQDQRKDVLEQVAIVQRDRETYAIAPHIPGGITNSDTLRRIAEVSDKYGCKALKLTSAQRIALVGIPADKIDEAWADLGMDKGQAIGYCVRSVKICPGTTFCKRAKQDSVALGLTLDKIYHRQEMPSKLKIGVSGCPNNCAESCVKDIGFMGGNQGFTVFLGGMASGNGRIAQIIYKDKTQEECLALTEDIVNLYKEVGRKGQRIGRLLDRVGIENFLKALEAQGEERASLVNELKGANGV